MLGNTMPLYPTWTDIAVRLLLTAIAGGLIGLDRQSGGHSAGFRTTVLVGLAACLTMIQANILLSVEGKTEHSFAVMDVLRFPLGVLTGVGFIGGGAILKRGDLITGVTTAATMWVVTAIGLCFGGGQILVGCAATVLVLVVLVPLKDIDAWLSHQQKGRVTIEAAADEGIPVLGALLEGIAEVRFAGKRRTDAESALYSYELHWKATGRKSQAADVLAAIEARYRIDGFEILDAVD
jgi:putative Mg2+ transporter-C (MgtC) family protein